MIQGGPGLLADPAAPPEEWGGRKAVEYKLATLRTYGRVCALCGLPGANSADHVIPISRGGAVYDLLNLQPAHARCNYARGNRDRSAATTIVENGEAFFSRE